MTPRQSGAELREEVATNGGAQGELLVRMDENLEALVPEVKELSASVHSLVTDVAVIKNSQEGCAKVQNDRWKDHKEEHKDLNRRSNLLDAAVAAGVAVAAWVGIKA